MKCFVSKKKSVDTRTMMLKDFKFDENDRFWKVITPRAAHKAFSGFGELLVASPDEIYTDSYIGFRVKNKAEAKPLQSYLRTRFANYMLGSRKVSQDICASTCARTNAGFATAPDALLALPGPPEKGDQAKKMGWKGSAH